MTSRHKQPVAGKEKKGVPQMSSSTPNERRRSLSLRPSTPPGTTVAKDHGKTPAATSSTTGEPRKHVPNYLKPTISSNPNAVKHSAVRKHAPDDDSHKPTPTMMRRRSFDRPVPASQVPRTVQSSGARGERTTPPFSPKHPASAAVTRPASSSSDRVSKVVKATKSQPPLLKTTKSMPRTSSSSSSGVKKEAKTSHLKKPASSVKEVTPSTEEEPVHAPNTIESEVEGQESLDLNVEEELAKMESPVDLPPPEKHDVVDKEHIDEESQSPKEHGDETKETVNSIDSTISQDRRDEHDETPEPVAESSENVEVTEEETQVVHEETQVAHVETQVAHVETQVAHDDTQVVHEIQYTNENDQHSIQAANETPAEENDQHSIQAANETPAEENDQHSIQAANETPADENDTNEKETTEEIKPTGLTVKTTADQKDDVAAEEEQGQHASEAGEEQQNQKEVMHKTEEEEKPANLQAENVVHKRHVGGPRNKKESPAYNDVIEETASRLVEKRVNKVRALAGAFETVISLQQPDSS